MKNNKYHLAKTWLLLLCFIAGQYMVYAHSHANSTAEFKSARHHSNTSPKQTITDNCRLCDAMHHNHMVSGSQVYFAHVVVTEHFYKAVNYDLIGARLIRSGGRSPPTA